MGISFWLMVSAVAQPEQSAEFSHSIPSELQFSCAGFYNDHEESLSKLLASGSKDSQLEASKELWNGHSRRHAEMVIKLISSDAPQTETFVAFRKSVESSLKPESILREVREGDYRWGTWLAFLRPHTDLVPELLDRLGKNPRFLSETILALGRSDDRRALPALFQLLNDSDYQTPGTAARALGYMKAPEIEPKLIDALSRDNGWLQVNACVSLSNIGTRNAIPALEQIANDKRPTGALSIKQSALSAIEKIKSREAK